MTLDSLEDAQQAHGTPGEELWRLPSRGVLGAKERCGPAPPGTVQPVK